MSKGNLKAYAQRIEMEVNAVNLELKVKDATSIDGRFYKCPNQDDEVSDENIDKITIGIGKKANICATGKYMATFGTEGSYTLMEGDNEICKIGWKCPYPFFRDNEFHLDMINDNDYIVQYKPNPISKTGAIGFVSIKVVSLRD